MFASRKLLPRLFSSSRRLLAGEGILAESKPMHDAMPSSNFGTDFKQSALALISSTESALLDSFQIDLQTIQSKFQQTQTILKTGFADNPVWKLFWNSDFISNLQSTLPSQASSQSQVIVC
jgi:hypothetical protein